MRRQRSLKEEWKKLSEKEDTHRRPGQRCQLDKTTRSERFEFISYVLLGRACRHHPSPEWSRDFAVWTWRISCCCYSYVKVKVRRKSSGYFPKFMSENGSTMPSKLSSPPRYLDTHPHPNPSDPNDSHNNRGGLLQVSTPIHTLTQGTPTSQRWQGGSTTCTFNITTHKICNNPQRLNTWNLPPVRIQEASWIRSET